MTDITKYRNVSLPHETYKTLIALSKVLLPDAQLSISKTIEFDKFAWNSAFYIFTGIDLSTLMEMGQAAGMEGDVARKAKIYYPKRLSRIFKFRSELIIIHSSGYFCFIKLATTNA